MATLSWIPIRRNYNDEKTKISMVKQLTSIHPLAPVKQRLLPIATTTSKGKDSATANASDVIADPLSAVLKNPVVRDPLSDPLYHLSVVDDPLRSNYTSSIKSNVPSNTEKSIPRDSSEKDGTNNSNNSNNNNNNLKSSWNVKKLQMLKDYALVGNITMKSSVIDDFDGSGVEDGSNTRKVDLYTQRLASLEKKDESTVTMTQKEYEDHIHKLNEDLNRAWANDERVGSLKIAIQLAKLLADTNVPKFYPYMFVMVTDILENFGEMVFNRLKSKAEDALSEGFVNNRRISLPYNFKPSDIPVNAKETCRNWFYKTACIRELLPRIYIEITLLKCYRFLTDTDYPSILSRLASIIRGLGDPMVAFYARTYLIITGNNNAPEINQYAISMVQDVMLTYRMFKEQSYLSDLIKLQVTKQEYFLSLSPSIEWLMKFVGQNATKEIFQAILYQYKEICNDAMMLKHIIDSFDSSYYSQASLGMATLIKSADSSSSTITDVFASLGKKLLSNPPPENQRLPLLNDVWKTVSKSEEIGSYVRCTFAWLDTVQQHYSERETLILLADLSIRLQSFTDEFPDTVLRQLEGILTSMVSQSNSLSQAVLTSDHLLKILDVFKGPKKVSICKDILEAFKKQPTTSDAILINTLFDIGRVLHDSFDYLLPISETKYLSRLIINGFINKIDFGRDLEQQLGIYVECRAIFCNFHLVMHQLVLHVSQLAIKALKFVKGKHNKKTAAFVKACLAYCHITIPSISDISSKLYLTLHCAQVSLVNNCLPQTDTFLKAAISLVPELPTYEEIDGKKVSTEDKLSSFVNCLLSFLVVVPGHPEHGPFYIVHGLLNALPRYPWPTAEIPTSVTISAAATKTRLYIEMLGLLATYAQNEMPYKIEGVDSNDTLYGNNPTYRKELSQLISTCIEEILTQLTAIGSGEKVDNYARLTQAKLVTHLILKVSSCIELSHDVSKFLIKLLELVKKQQGIFGKIEIKVFRNTLDYLLLRAAATTTATNTGGGGAVIARSSDEEATQSLVTFVKNVQTSL